MCRTRSGVFNRSGIQQCSLVGLFMIMLLSITLSHSSPIVDTKPFKSSVNHTAVTADDYDDLSSGDFSTLELSTINLSVSLEEGDSTVDGSMFIDYRNDAPMAISQIPFHIYPSGMTYENRPGSIEISSVACVDEPSLVEGFQVQDDDQLLWVDLTSPLDSGDYVALEIEFVTTLPDGGYERAGEHGSDTAETRIFTFASSYPIPCVYDRYDGWNTDPYLPVGDPFYFGMAFYDFYVELPEGMIVAATGDPTVITNVSGRVTYHYSIEAPVREVTFSASRYYRVESALCNDVNVSAFYLPASDEAWEEDALEQALQALELFNATYGIYPYPTLNIVEQHASYGGMEYPCQVYATRLITQQVIDGDASPWYLELVIAHEIAHQWWSQLVGDDCVDWGFLDEGLTCWSHSYYAEVYYSDWEYFQAERYLDTVRSFTARNGIGCVVNASNLVRPELTGYADYVKMPLILQKLRLTIGLDVFITGIQSFLQNYYFRIATPVDLRNSFELAAGTDLDWFFVPWLDNGYLPDYEIQSAVFDPEQSILSFTVVDLNRELNGYDYSQPIPILVYGVGPDVLVEETVWVNGSETLSYSLDSAPERIRLDYHGYVLVALDEQSLPWYDFENIQTALPLLPVIGIGIVGVTAVLIVVFYFRKQRT